MLPINFSDKSNFTNKNVLYLFNRSIYEYDMHSADINLCKYFDILPKEKIEKIEKLDKLRRVVAIGKLQKNKEFQVRLKKAFADMRNIFYEANDLDINDIIAVKKDAIFTTNQCKETKFKNVEFQVKNTYSSFVQIQNLELYYGNGHCDVKGIDDEVLHLHDDYMLKTINIFFRKMETESVQDTLSYMNRICSQYKFRQLPLEYYREFNNNSKYVLTNSTDTYDEFWDESINELDITYNFTKILIPLVKIAL